MIHFFKHVLLVLGFCSGVMLLNACDEKKISTSESKLIENDKEITLKSQNTHDESSHYKKKDASLNVNKVKKHNHRRAMKIKSKSKGRKLQTLRPSKVQDRSSERLLSSSIIRKEKNSLQGQKKNRTKITKDDVENWKVYVGRHRLTFSKSLPGGVSSPTLFQLTADSYQASAAPKLNEDATGRGTPFDQGWFLLSVVRDVN